MIEFTRVDFPNDMYRLDPCVIFHNPETGVVNTKQVFVEDAELLMEGVPANHALISYSDIPGGSAMLYAVEVIDGEVTFNQTKALEFAGHYLKEYTIAMMDKALAKDKLDGTYSADNVKAEYDGLLSNLSAYTPEEFKALMELLQSNALYSQYF